MSDRNMAWLRWCSRTVQLAVVLFSQRTLPITITITTTTKAKRTTTTLSSQEETPSNIRFEFRLVQKMTSGVLYYHESWRTTFFIMDASFFAMLIATLPRAQLRLGSSQACWRNVPLSQSTIRTVYPSETWCHSSHGMGPFIHAQTIVSRMLDLGLQHYGFHFEKKKKISLKVRGSWVVSGNTPSTRFRKLQRTYQHWGAGSCNRFIRRCRGLFQLFGNRDAWSNNN